MWPLSLPQQWAAFLLRARGIILSVMFFILTASTIVLLTLSLLALQMLSTTPTQPLTWQSNINVARAVFKKASEQAQQQQDISLDTSELNYVLNSVLNRYVKSMIQLHFEAADRATATLTLKLAKLLNGYYINAHFVLRNQPQGLQITQLTIGNLAVNHRLTGIMLHTVLQHSVLKQYYLLALQHIQNITLRDYHLLAHYALNPNSTGFAGAYIIEPDSLAFYQHQLEHVINQHNPRMRLSLAELLSPLFRLAYEQRQHKNAITENIAIIAAVSAYVNHNDIPFYVTLKLPSTTRYLYPVFLYKRTDQAKHFMLSAILTTTGGPLFADIMGQEKELRDAQSTSGFSFIDLAADRAGMKFSEQAIRSPENARALQRIMADIKDYSTFMPNMLDLPEKLTYAQFTQRFETIGSKAYRTLLQQIDDRIEALPIYPRRP